MPASVSSELAAIRKANLALLLEERFDGNMTELGRKSGVNAHHVSLLLTDNPRHARRIGEGLARRIERGNAMPVGYMDKAHRRDGLPPVGPAQIVAAPLSPAMSRALVAPPSMVSAHLLQSWVADMSDRITSVSRLTLASPANNEMAPLLEVGDTLIVDTGAKVAGDGVYVLSKAGAAFIRRVTRNLSGGYTITAQAKGAPSTEVKTMRGFDVYGKVVCSFKAVPL